MRNETLVYLFAGFLLFPLAGINDANAYGVPIENGPTSQSQFLERDYSESDKGYVVLSMSGDTTNVDPYRLLFDLQSEDGKIKIAMGYARPLWFDSHKNDFHDGKIIGDLAIRSLPPGKYILRRFVLLAAAGCGRAGVNTNFSIPFTVTQGRTTYLGSFTYQPIVYDAVLMGTCSNGGYLIETDEHPRDLALANSKTGVPAENASIQLPDIPALKLPLFQPGPLPLHASAAVKTSNTEFTDGHDLIGKDDAKAKALLQQALASGDFGQSDQAYAHSWLGVIAIREKDIKAAISEYDEAIRLDPELFAAWGDRASAKLALHDIDGAYIDAKMAENLSPRFPNWHKLLGDLEFIRRNTDMAFVDYDDAIALAPKYTRAYLGHARVNIFLKKYDAAIEDIQKATAAGAMEQKTGLAYTCLLNGRYIRRSDSLTDCDKLVALDPKNPVPLTTRGVAKLSVGNSKGALDDFDAALVIKPDAAEALYGRGKAKQMLHDSSAQTDIDAALKIDPHAKIDDSWLADDKEPPASTPQANNTAATP